MQIIAAFRGAEERAAAATSIFPTLPDPTDLPALLAALPREQRDAVHSSLGLLAFFDAANPTGRYHLDMAVPTHRVVLARLVTLSAQDGAWAADATLRNLRNVIVGSMEVDVPDPTVFVVPKRGHVQVHPPPPPRSPQNSGTYCTLAVRAAVIPGFKSAVQQSSVSIKASCSALSLYSFPCFVVAPSAVLACA